MCAGSTHPAKCAPSGRTSGSGSWRSRACSTPARAVCCSHPFEARSLIGMDRAAPVSVPAEVAIFVTRRRGQEVLLLLRAPSGGGYWHVVAGAIEAGGTSEAAQRELWRRLAPRPTQPCLEVVEYVTAEGTPATGPSTTQPSVSVPITRYVTACRPHGSRGQRGARLSQTETDERAPLPRLIWPQTAWALRRALGQ